MKKDDDAMELLWKQLATKDKKGHFYITFNGKQDLEDMYQTGFVDTDKYSLTQWIEVFKTSLRSDGRYFITKEEWLKKKPYRYDGSVDDPFNPMTIREGEWSEDDFKKLIKIKIIPNSSLNPQKFKIDREVAKKQNRYVDGKFIVNKLWKVSMKSILDQHPSPKRVREIQVAEAVQRLKEQEKEGKKEKTKAAKDIKASIYRTETDSKKVAMNQLDKILSGKK